MAKLLSERTSASAPSSEQRTAAERLVIDLLRRAVAAGYRDRPAIEREAAFSTLHARPEFQSLLARLAGSK
jgi:hypothetical protein